jgi:cyclopropane fatty-acyl-phospholipid synthase-like methyltransferase
MLYFTAVVWRLRSLAHDEVLDVGCGLGGSAIFWAQEFASNVTAVTIAPSHVDLVQTFAAQAGVQSRVHPYLCDALAVPGQRRFDVVMAIDSSCHLPRQAWFRRVAALLRKGGRIFVADCFLERSEYRAPFDSYWCAQIGTMTEYRDAARDAGFREESLEDISHRTVHFWEVTLALIRAEMRNDGPRRSAPTKFEESLAAHALMRRGLGDGGLRYGLMSFAMR